MLVHSLKRSVQARRFHFELIMIRQATNVHKFVQIDFQTSFCQKSVWWLVSCVDEDSQSREFSSTQETNHQTDFYYQTDLYFLLFVWNVSYLFIFTYVLITLKHLEFHLFAFLLSFLRINRIVIYAPKYFLNFLFV